MATVAEAFVTMRPDFGQFGQQVQSGLSGFGSSAIQAGGAITALTAPIAALGAGIITSGAEFQTQMNRVRAVSGATGDDFEALSELAQQLGRTTQYTAGQAADALGFLAMAGFDVDEMLAALPSTLQLAAAGQMDLGRAADITTNILTGYGLAVDQLGHANDVLVKAMTSSNVDLSMLGEAFKYVGPVAVGAGIAFEESAAAIGLMGNAGIQGSMAGTSLRGAITRLLNPTQQVASRIKALGLETKDSEGNLLSLVEIVRGLEESGATTSDMMAIFGQRAGPAMAALVEQGSEALADMTSELGSAGGIAERVSEIQMEGFRGAMLRMKSAWEGLSITLAESGVLDLFANLLDGVALKLQQAAEWFENLDPKWQQFLLIAGGAAIALGPTLIALGALALAIGALISPIGLVIVGLGALVTAGVLLWQNWDEVSGAISNIWDTITQTFEDNKTLILAALAPLAVAFAPIVLAIGGLITAGKLLWEHWDEVKGFLAASFETIRDVALPVFAEVSEAVSVGWGIVSDVTSTVWEEVTDVLSTAFGFISDNARPTFDAAVSAVVTAWETARDTTIAVWETIASTLEGIWNSRIGTELRATLTKWGGWISDAWGAVSGVTTDVWNAISGFLSTHWGTISSVANTIWTGISTFLDANWTVIRTLAEVTFGAIGAFFETWFGVTKTVFETAWKIISTIVGTQLDIIEDIIVGVMKFLQGDIDGAMEEVKGIFSKAWDAIEIAIGIAWEGFLTAIQIVWDTIIYPWLRDLPGKILDAIGSLAGLLTGAGKDLIDGLASAARDAWVNMRTWLDNLPTNIKAAIGSVANLLWQIGSDIINGLWNGMKSKWNDVSGWLGQRAGQIASLKGPIEKDRKLLIPEGAAIMEGLGAGMREGWRDIERLLGGMTMQIPTLAAVTPAPALATTPQSSPSAPAPRTDDRPIVVQLTLDGRVIDERIVRWSEYEQTTGARLAGGR